MADNKNFIGAHVSIAGGIQNAPGRAKEEGCETFQCFTRSPQGGPAPELTPALISSFHTAMKENEIKSFVIHAPYYINLASLNNRIRHGSIKVIRDELERGSMLGTNYVMFHPGSHSGQSREEGIEKAKNGLEKILDGYTGTTKLLIEISAGAGSVLGDTFEEVAQMMTLVKKSPGFGGICFDTCHAFASGYDFRTADGAKNVLAQFDKIIGLEWLKLTHVNDSKIDLGGKQDRHEHIDKGYIGYAGLKEILTSKPFQKIDWILETETEGRLEDIKKLNKVRDNIHT
ncbi:MAG: deoxyribonuclease IV [Patescibacteria group bacterium]